MEPMRAPLSDTSHATLPRPEAAVVEQWCCTYSTTRDRDLRARIVEAHDWLVRCCVHQTCRPGQSFDDLMQVGTIGLLNAIDRFDPAFGVKFRTFASATIVGELRHHQRGTWRLKVTRSTQERYLVVREAIDALTTKLQRVPTATDIADYLGLGVDDVVRAVAVGAALSPLSLDSDRANGPVRPGLSVAVDDDELQRVDLRDGLRQSLMQLGERERLIVYLRYYRDMSQAEIAVEVGVSQVHVSRLLRAALETLRAAA
jgi:RNA polymerase sigma-B factor